MVLGTVCAIVMSSQEGEQTTEKPCGEQRLLWAVLEVEVGDACPLTDIEEPVYDIDLQQTRSVCRSEVVTSGDDIEVVHLEREMDDQCLADVFHDHGCVPHVTDVEGDSLIMTVHPPSREQIPQLVGELRETGYPVSTRRIVGLDGQMGSESRPVLCDSSVLTEKQRRALDVAMSRGYYDEPKAVTLSELAGDLGISKSALSRRLRSAESKILRNCIARSDGL